MASLQLLMFIFVLNFGASVVFGALALGDSVILHLVWQFTVQILGDQFITGADAVLREAYSSDIMIVTVMTSVRHFFVALLLAYLMRRAVNWELFAVIAVGQGLSVIIGVELLSRADPWLLKTVFAAFLYLFSGVFMVISVVKLRRAGRQVSATDTEIGAGEKRSYSLLVWASFASLCAGILTGLVGVGGPPLEIFILIYDLPMNVVRGTFPAASAVVAVIRSAYAAYRGQYLLSLWHYYVVIIISAILGVFVGHRIAKQLSQLDFYICIVSLLFLAGVSMTTLTPFTLLLAVSFNVAYVVFAVKMGRRTKKESEEPPVAAVEGSQSRCAQVRSYFSLLFNRIYIAVQRFRIIPEEMTPEEA